MLKSRTITTFLIDGNPTGFRKIYLNNRIIIGFFISRKEIEKLKNREEFLRSGVYFLIGKDENEKNLVYIGQSINLFERIKQHHNDSSKDYWNGVIAFTTTDGSWNESDIIFLEKILIEDAKNLNNYIVKNSKNGNLGPVREEQISSLEENIEDIKILISSLGFSIYKEKIQEEDKKEKYFCKKNGNNGIGYYTEEGFLVLKGSIGNFKIKENSAITLKKMQEKLFSENIIKKENEKIIFLEDYLFSAPSTASGIIIGNNSNGWWEWRTKDGKTLDEMERKNKNI